MSPLPKLLLAASAVLGLALPAFAEKPKFAVVDITRAFEAYHVTILEKEKIRESRAALKRDPRLEKIKLMELELVELRDKVRDVTLSEGERQLHYREFHLKDQDLRKLQRDAREDLSERSRTIDVAMVHKTRHLLGEVRAVVQKVSEEGGFDFAFEKSGKTSSQIPTLIYIRDATDITDLVIEILNNGNAVETDIATVGKPVPVKSAR
jgi:Skp family chaperone for outer membrane proteins